MIGIPNSVSIFSVIVLDAPYKFESTTVADAPQNPPTTNIKNIQNFFKEKPADYLIGHAHNFQVGVSTWVTDHRIAKAEEQKIFALEGHKEYPICSNSICLKELDEMSDNYYLLSKPGINRLQAYDRETGKPLNIFILKDL